MFFQCQKDDVDLNTELDRTQRTTEIHTRQRQARALEIAASKEFQNAMNQCKLFFERIYDKNNFFKEGLFDLDNKRYNDHVLKERLSLYTSFKTVNEFIQEQNKVSNFSKKLVTKYSGLEEKLLQDEIYKAYKEKSEYQVNKKGNIAYCKKRFNKCMHRALIAYLVSEGGCCFYAFAGGPLCGIACHVIGSTVFVLALDSCGDDYNDCKRN